MPRIIALDLGEHSVKVATWRGTRGVFLPEDRVSHKVPQDGSAVTREAIFATLDAILAENSELKNAGGDQVCLSFGVHHLSAHRLVVPFSDTEQVGKTLPFVVEDMVPLDIEDLSLAWRAVQVDMQTEAVVTIARTEMLSEWIGGLAERGLDPAVMVPSGELQARWFDDEGAPSEGMVAVVDVGHGKTTVTVLRDGTVVSYRSVAVGGRHMTRAMQGETVGSWEDAERFKHELGAWSDLPEEMRAGVDAALGTLLAGVRSSLIEEEDQLGQEVRAVYLTGGGSRLVGLQDFMARDLGVPVQPLVTDAEPEATLVQAMGDLMVAGKRGELMDLRVDGLAYRGGTDMFRTVATYGGAGAAFFFIAMLVMTGIQWSQYNTEVERLDTNIREVVGAMLPDVGPEELSDGAVALSFLAIETEEAAQRAAALAETIGGVPPTVDLLYELHNALPKPEDVELRVSEITVTEQMVTFNAEADGYADSSAVEEALKQHPNFRSASKGKETRLKDGHVKFPITIALGLDVDVDAEGDVLPDAESEEG